jgi:hypothetical protein
MTKKLIDILPERKSDLVTLPSGIVVRDKTFSSTARFCWNPACNYLVGIARSACTNCRWTAQGPIGLTVENPSKHAKTRAMQSLKEREERMNKTERRYAAYLEQQKQAGAILFYKFEAIKLRIGPDCFWNVDFLVVDKDGYVELHDTKAYWKSKGRVHVEDDARVKMVAAAHTEFPVFTVLAVWEKDGEWHKKVF